MAGAESQLYSQSGLTLAPTFQLRSSRCRGLAPPGPLPRLRRNPKMQCSGRGVKTRALTALQEGVACALVRALPEAPAGGSHVTGAGRGHAGGFEILVGVEL